jgi:glucose/arabinose dehydrogenase
MIQFTPDQDVTLYEDGEGGVSNGSGNFVFIGRTGPDGDSMVRRTLIRFDVSAIPPDAIIDDVALSFEIVEVPFVSATGGTAALHRVQANWGEGGSNAPGPEGQGTLPQGMDATWLHRRFDTEFWGSAGGDFALQPSATTGYSTDPETLTFSYTPALVRDVRKWLRYPDENYGWVLLGNEGLDFTARKMDSRDQGGGSPALLTVEYHIEGPTDDLILEPVASGLSQAVVITNAGDGSNRLFIVQQPGVIRIVDLATGNLLPTPFLDISALVDDQGSEQGLLGLAFHPDFENNRQFYVNYTRDPGPGLDRTRVAMYQASLGNPNIADTAETVVLEFEQDFSNHNGGDMHFDPNGYLVIAAGDGGDGNDPNNRGQTLTTLLGKMLRIDVDTVSGSEKCGLVSNYGIPDDNPFNGPADGCDEILHYGMRNPWRFSFDARTGEMFIGDVGQGLWEEISYAPLDATGINFGWKICEGAHVRGSQSSLCDSGTLPIIEYSSSGTGNCSVTGGYFYRGGIRSLQGWYIYADYCSARIWIATYDGEDWNSEEWSETPTLGAIPTFGQDETCELYVSNFSNSTIYRFVDTEEIDHSGFEELRCQ